MSSARMLMFKGESISLDAACLIGIGHYQRSELVEAVAVLNQIISADPSHPRALNVLAVIEIDRGNYDRAETLLNSLLEVHPDFVKGYNTRGILLLKMKKVGEAEQQFLKALELQPDFAEAYGNLGDIQLMQRNYCEAAECFSKLISFNAQNSQAHCSLAEALLMLGRFDEAETHLTTSLELVPQFVPALLTKGALFRMQGNYTEALSVCETALTYAPDNAICHCYLGMIYYDSKNLSRALECLLVAQQLNPSDPLTELNLGNIYWETEELELALQAYSRGLQLSFLAADIFMMYNGLGSTFMSMGFPGKGLEMYRIAQAMDPENMLVHSNLLFAMHYPDTVTADEIYKESLQWGKNHPFEPLANSQPCANAHLKIGFLSADFKNHSVSYFFEPLLAALDRQRFEVYCYSGVSTADAMTARLKSLTDCWVDCFGMADDLLADKILADKIDILVDLSGHTCGNRLGVFARRPAPIQITWLGYPGTTGLTTMDYRITDATADPIGVTDTLHTEKLLRLADCFLCYLPPKEAPPVTSPPYIKNKSIMFGSFNNISKITPPVLIAWGRILDAVPDSSLMLKSKAFKDAENCENWMKLLASYGITPDRISLLSYVPSKTDHFAVYGEVDIALDAFPYNGTTTTCEALWMGVPVVTLAGDRHSSRVGASILACVGLHDLVTDSLDEYVARAIELAANKERLLLYRQTMRERLLASPLCDSVSFAARWGDAVVNITRAS